MSYFYNNYPYLVNMPIIYLQQSLTYLVYSQRNYINIYDDILKNRVDEIKIQAKESDSGPRCLKQESPLKYEELKCQFQNNEFRKRQTDSFTEKRNIMPNNINHVLAFVQRKRKSQPLVEKLLKKYDITSKYTSKRFYAYQNQIKQQLHVYVSKQSLYKLVNHLDLHSSIFSVDQQMLYNRICRILMCFYLRDKASITILSSLRVKQTSKKDHLQAQRDLLNFILKLSCYQ